MASGPCWFCAVVCNSYIVIRFISRHDGYYVHIFLSMNSHSNLYHRVNKCMYHYFCCKPHINYTGYGYTTCGRVIGHGLFKSIRPRKTINLLLVIPVGVTILNVPNSKNEFILFVLSLHRVSL
jgi:hypothetical protein